MKFTECTKTIHAVSRTVLKNTIPLQRQQEETTTKPHDDTVTKIINNLKTLKIMKKFFATMVKMFTEQMEITGNDALNRRMACKYMNGYL